MNGATHAIRRALGAAVTALLAPTVALAASIADREVVWNPPPIEQRAPGETLPTVAELESRGARLGRILVRVYDIFDESDPKENTALYRLANRLHITTKERAILAQLTFRPGEPVSASQLRESARILRDRRYLYDAIVRPVRYDASANIVDVEVLVRDVWTLNPGISFGRSGGENHAAFELQDQNFLGLGKNLQFRYEKDVDRSSTGLRWDDPNLFGSRWTMSGEVADLSDGHTYALTVERPFYSFMTRRSGGVALLDDERETGRFELGHEVDSFNVKRQYADVRYGWSQGLVDGVTRRWSAGFTYDDSRFAPVPGVPLVGPLPDDRTFAYPWLQYERLEDAWEDTRNQNQIGRTENLYLGSHLWARVGLAPTAFGSTADAVMFSGAYFRGARVSEGFRYEWNSGLDGRLEAGQLRDTVLSSEARTYYQISQRRLFYANLSGTVTDSLSADRQLLLGGDNGLRGYPLRYQSGSSRALLTLEYRVFTNWYPFRLVNVGGALFFDAGRTWGQSFTGAEPLGVLKDVGLGLRFGNARSGLGSVLHIDFAWALDAPPGEKDFQVLINTKASF